jgi:hypothetical protein
MALEFEFAYYLYKSVYLMSLQKPAPKGEATILSVYPKAYEISMELKSPQTDDMPRMFNDKPYLLNVDKRTGSLFLQY